MRTHRGRRQPQLAQRLAKLSTRKCFPGTGGQHLNPILTADAYTRVCMHTARTTVRYSPRKLLDQLERVDADAQRLRSDKLGHLLQRCGGTDQIRRQSRR